MGIRTQAGKSICGFVQCKALERGNQHNDNQSYKPCAKNRKSTLLGSSFAASHSAQSQQQKQAKECHCDKLTKPSTRIFGKSITFNVYVRLSTKEILELNDYKCDEQDHNTTKHNRRFSKAQER